MARARLISTSIGSSRRFCRVHVLLETGALSEFAQLLFILLVVNSDDFGRTEADPFTVKLKVFPGSPRPEGDFESALQALAEVGLIDLYEVNGNRLLAIVKFDEHQSGLHKRTASKFPAPPGSTSTALDADESDIEDILAADLETGSLAIGDFKPVSVVRQHRVGNKYIDILATDSSGQNVLLEVKRHKITEKAVAQALGYADLLHDTTCQVVVCGCGVSPTAIGLSKRVILLDLDVNLVARQVCGERLAVVKHVRTCYPESPEVTSLMRARGTEEKRREEKRREPPYPPGGGNGLSVVFEALAHACGLDLEVLRERDAQKMNLLISDFQGKAEFRDKPKYLAEAFRQFGRWYYEEEWEGHRPTLDIVRSKWGSFYEWSLAEKKRKENLTENGNPRITAPG